MSNQNNYLQTPILKQKQTECQKLILQQEIQHKKAKLKRKQTFYFDNSRPLRSISNDIMNCKKYTIDYLHKHFLKHQKNSIQVTLSHPNECVLFIPKLFFDTHGFPPVGFNQFNDISPNDFINFVAHTTPPYCWENTIDENNILELLSQSYLLKAIHFYQSNLNWVLSRIGSFTPIQLISILTYAMKNEFTILNGKKNSNSDLIIACIEHFAYHTSELVLNNEHEKSQFNSLSEKMKVALFSIRARSIELSLPGKMSNNMKYETSNTQVIANFLFKNQVI